MAIDCSLKYENLHTNYRYGSLARDDFWEPEEKLPSVPKIKRPQIRVQQPAQPKKKKNKSRVRFNWSFFKKARKPLVQEETQVRAKPGISYTPRLVKIAVAVISIMFMLTYLISVCLGQLTTAAQLELVALQRQETELRNEANELRIAVEQLKGPERIREIATGQLNMLVARDNVYVKAVQVQTIGDYYRNATSVEKNIFFALGK